MTTSHTPEDRSVNSSLLKAHTPGRLEVAPCGDDDYAASIQQIDGDPYSFVVGDVFTKEDARRLVACWNFCLDMQTETLEAMTSTAYQMLMQKAAEKQELLEAAKNLMEWIEVAHRPPVRDEIEGGRMVLVRLHALADLREAIAKAEGKA